MRSDHRALQMSWAARSASVVAVVAVTVAVTSGREPSQSLGDLVRRAAVRHRDHKLGDRKALRRGDSLALAVVDQPQPTVRHHRDVPRVSVVITQLAAVS